MGVSFRMDGWLGNSGIQPDGALAVGLGSGPSPRRCRVSRFPPRGGKKVTRVTRAKPPSEARQKESSEAASPD